MSVTYAAHAQTCTQTQKTTCTDFVTWVSLDPIPHPVHQPVSELMQWCVRKYTSPTLALTITCLVCCKPHDSSFYCTSPITFAFLFCLYYCLT